LHLQVLPKGKTGGEAENYGDGSQGITHDE
jgi:hypothetical protein